ncbi:glycosyltransferase [Thermoproteota archaeon]
MNILHIISEFDSIDVVLSVNDLLSRLAREGHSCFIVSSGESCFQRQDGVSVKCILIPGFTKNFYQTYRAFKKLKTIILENKIEVIHSHSALTSWVALFLSRATNVSFVTTCHNFYSKNLFNVALFLGKKIIVHHQAVGTHLLGKFKISVKRIQFIPQGLDFENIEFQDFDQRSKTDFKIGMISPLRLGKGHECFLKAMVRVVRNIPSIKIYVATNLTGSKPQLKKELALLIRRLGLTSYVELIDTPNLDLNFVLNLNVLVAVSTNEDASTRVILEAQARGVPVVASHIAGFCELVSDGKTGILVPPNDHDALAVAVIKILRNFKLAREITFTARKAIIDKFDIRRTITDYIDLYNQAICKKSILIINLGEAQEVIFTIPALRALKKELPDIQIVNLVNSASRCVFQRCPYIDDLIVYETFSHRWSPFGFIKIAGILLEKRFDMVLDLSNSFRTHLLSYLTLANKRYGYRNRAFKFLINHNMQRPQAHLSVTEQSLLLLDLLGIKSKDHKLELWLSQEDKKVVEDFLNDNWIGKEKIAGLDLSSQMGFLKNNGPVERLAYLCDRLAQQDMRVIIIGASNNISAKNELLKKMQSKPISAIGDIPTTQLACLIKRCDIYITSNPKSLYIASALKTPSIILSSVKDASKSSLIDKVGTNMDILTDEDIRLDRLSKGKRKSSSSYVARDVIFEKINKLMKVQ